MKKILLLIFYLIILFCFNLNTAISGPFEWVKIASGPYDILPKSLLYNDDKIICITGMFTLGINFGNNKIIESKTDGDVFVAVFDKETGECLKYKGFGGSVVRSVSRGISIIDDGLGNLIIGGSFTEDIIFNEKFKLSSSHQPGGNIFLAKLDTGLNCIWAKKIITSQNIFLFDMESDKQGNFLICGWFSGTVKFEDGKEFSSGDREVYYLAKMKNDGELIWFLKDTVGTSKAQDLSVSEDGKIFLTGEFVDSCIFDKKIIYGKNKRSDIFLTAISSDGDCLWAKSFGGKANDYSYQIYSKGDSVLYLTGDAGGFIDFGNGLIIDTVSNKICGFLVKFNQNGDCQMVKAIYGKSQNSFRISSILEDMEGNITIGGYFTDSLYLNTNILLTSLRGTMTYRDAYLAKCNSKGEFYYAIAFGGYGYDNVLDMLISDKNTLYILGTFQGEGFFGDITRTALGYSDMYFAKFNDPTLQIEEKTIINPDVMVISPNPVKDYIELGVRNLELGVEKIEIYNMLGECVLTAQIHPMTSSHRMNIEMLPAGIYFIRKGEWTGKFVKL